MATGTTTDPGTAKPATPGDNRGAGDLDGNKAGARTGNKAPGPDEPAPADLDDQGHQRDHNQQSTSKE